jgi:ATP-dependent protease ClpP protease subunit
MQVNEAGEAELTIFGPISGQVWFGDEVSLAAVKEALDQVRSAPKIRVLLNSPGGEATEGVAIYNLLGQVRDRLTVEVMGIAASAASVIALAGKELIMGEGSYLMIHEPWGITVGPADEHTKTAEVLQKMAGNFADIYTGHSGLSREDALAAMKAETWYTAAEAVEAGFADEVAGGAAAAALGFDLGRYGYKRTPDGVLARSQQEQKPPQSIREFEDLLRDAGGFSRNESKRIAAKGFPKPREAEEGDAGGVARIPASVLQEELRKVQLNN